MKIKILTSFIFITLLLISCNKNEDANLNISSQETNSLDLNLFLSHFEIVKIDIADLHQSLQSQTGPIKQFTLLDGRYNFKVANSNLNGNLDFYSINNSDEIELITPTYDNTLYLDNLGIQDGTAPVGMILREHKMYLEFSENDETYILSALQELIPEAKSNEYILYKQSAILESTDEGSDCHLTQETPTEFGTQNSNQSETRAAQYDVTNTVVIDYSMHNRLGWNGSINYVNDAMYMTNFRYNANSGLPIAIIKGSGYILNQPGQYGLSYSSSPTTYLNNYAAWLSRYGIANDASILFTSDHAHWGAAYMNTICGYYGVALVEWHSWSTRRYNIVAHEIGHILGAGHTNSGVMRTVANGESSFIQYSKNQILNYLASAGWCL